MIANTKEELLDCFAIEAMKLLVQQAGSTLNPYRVAETAYTVAERMLERREKIFCQWKIDGNIVQDGIEKLHLTVRSERCLKAEGILTIQQLQGCTKRDLMKTPNLGLKSIREIIEQMAALGYSLRNYT
jgi:DNA-directed RNA polymerase alpha subunit